MQSILLVDEGVRTKDLLGWDYRYIKLSALDAFFVNKCLSMTSRMSLVGRSMATYVSGPAILVCLCEYREM